MAKREFSAARKAVMFLEAALLIPLINLLSLLIPYKNIYSFAKRAGAVLIKFDKNKKNIIDKNIKIILKRDLPDSEKKDIYEVVAGYELRIILEMIAFSRMDFQDMISYIRIMQRDAYSKMFHRDNGIVAFTLHSGNWELLAAFSSSLGVPLVCVAERQFNPYIDRYITLLRGRLGVQSVYNEISEMRPLLRHMKTKGVAALVADQRYWFDPMFIPFFGEEAAVPAGTAALAVKTKASLMCTWSYYLGGGVYGIKFEFPADISDTEDIMKTVYKYYEEIIKSDLKNWYTLGSDRWGLTRKSLAEWEKNPDSSRF